MEVGSWKLEVGSWKLEVGSWKLEVMSIARDIDLHLTRRQLFGLTARGIGAAALGSVLSPDYWRRGRSPPARRARPEDRRSDHAAALRAEGQARHLPAPVRRAVAARLFDYKPGLAKSRRTQDLPDSIRRASAHRHDDAGRRRLPVAPSMFKFAQHGQCGAWVSELLPHTATIVDDIVRHQDRCTPTRSITIRRSRSSRPARSSRAGRAWARGSATAWAARTQNLPAFVVMISQATREHDGSAALLRRLWGSGFLPSSYQGVQFRSSGDPVLYLVEPARHRPRRPRAADARRLSRSSTRCSTTTIGDPEIAHAHRAIRDGLPHADERAGADRSVEGARSTSRDVRPRVAQRRAPSPPTACWRAGWPSAACASCSSSTAAGTSTATCRSRYRAPVPGHRPADRRARHGPEAARPARRHARHLGRRVRPHGLSARAS